MTSFAKKYYSLLAKLPEDNSTDLLFSDIPNQIELDNFVDWWSEIYKVWLKEFPDRLFQIDYDEIKIRKEFILKLGFRK